MGSVAAREGFHALSSWVEWEPSDRDREMQLTIRQVAELFGVSDATVTRWIREDNLPVHHVHSQFRFDRAELLEWAACMKRSISPAIFQQVNGDVVSDVSVADAIQRGGVALNVEGNDRYEVLHAAVDGLRLPASFDRARLLDLLVARDKAGGVAVGDGIAIPHPRYPIVLPDGEPIVRVCYLRHPLDYRAMDGIPVDTLFLMVSSTVHQHLQLLAKLACLLQSEEFRRLLKTRPDATRLIAAVRGEEAELGPGKEANR